MKHKTLIWIVVSLSLIFIISISFQGSNSGMIPHKAISGIIIERYNVDQTLLFQHVDTMEISDPSKIAKLVRILDKKPSQKVSMKLDILILYKNNILITINFTDNSNLILAVRYQDHREQNDLAWNRLSVSGGFTDEHNLYELSEQDIVNFISAIS